MAEQSSTAQAPLKPGRIGAISVYLIFVAVFVRAFGVEEMRPLLPRYTMLELIYIILFTLVLWKYTLPHWLMHLYLVVQCVLVFIILSLRPQFDFATVFFVLLTYQVSLVFTGRVRWLWIGILVVLCGASLAYYLGIRGLAISLSNIAAGIVVPAYIIVNHEIEMARAKSQALLSELQVTHQQLQSYAEQVAELAATQERNRLARELHDTVSQLMFSISLTTRSAQMLLAKDPRRAAEELKRLQVMSGDALSQLRSLITQLRPPKAPEHSQSA